MRPIGPRVLIKPEAQAEQTESGLALVEHRKPATAGTVVATGVMTHPLRADALQMASRLRNCVEVCDPDEISPDVLEQAASLVLSATAREPEVKPGDYVLYSWQSGQELQVDDETYIILREDEILAVLE